MFDPCFIRLALMAVCRRRYFTAKEVAAMNLNQEDDNWLLGGAEQRAREDVGASGEDDDGDGRHQTEGGLFGLEIDESDNDDGEDQHFGVWK